MTKKTNQTHLLRVDTVDFAAVTSRYVPAARAFVDAVYKAAEEKGVPAQVLNRGVGEIEFALRILEKHAGAIQRVNDESEIEEAEGSEE